MRFKQAVLTTTLRLLGFKVYTTLDGYHFVWLGPRSRVRRAYYIEDFC